MTFRYRAFLFFPQSSCVALTLRFKLRNATNYSLNIATMGRRKHKRSGGSNYIDPPSDEETEIETHAHRDPGSGKAHYDYLAFQTKRMRSNSQSLPNPITPADTPTADQAESEEASDGEKKRYQVTFDL